MSHSDPATLALAALGEEIPAADSAHLQACQLCRLDAAELAEVVTMGREAPIELAPAPTEVWESIRAELGLLGPSAGAGRARTAVPPPARATAGSGAAAPAQPAGGAVVPLRPRRPRLWAVASIAAAAGALAGGTLVWATTDAGSGRSAPSQEAIVAHAVLEPLKSDIARAGQAEVLDSPDGEVVRVDATALPPRDGFYEVWLIDTGVTKLVALGALPAGSVGTFTVPPGVSIADYPVVDISLEPLDGDPAHSKDSLMRGVLEA